MIVAAAFDLGGVLFAEGKSAAIDALSKKHGYDGAPVEAVMVSPKSVQWRKGMIAEEQFWAWARTALPRGYDTDAVRTEWHEGYTLDEDIRRLISRLKGGYTTIAFSANTSSRIAFLDDKYDFRKLFDAEVYSFDHELTKADESFAEIMVRAAGCRAEQIVYVDDDETAALPARRLGVNALIYSAGGIRRLKRSLRELGVEC